MKRETTSEIKKPRRRQMERLKHIVSMLKQNRKVTIASLVKDFDEMSRLPNGDGWDCSEITIKRDLVILKDNYDCPIFYERSEKTYKIKDLKWEFPMPSIVGEHAVLAAVLGAKMAEDVFPPAVSSIITGAVDELLKNNSADLDDRSIVESLKIFPSMGAGGDIKSFPVVFEAWKRHRALKIWYEKPGEAIQERVVKPMALVFAERKWFTYCYCEDKKKYRNFALSRIQHAEMLKEVFDIDLKAIEHLTPESFLQYDMLENVRIRITAKAKAYVEGNFISSKPVIASLEEGYYMLSLSRVPLEAVVPWVLAQGGEAVVLEPQVAVEAVKNAAKAVLVAAESTNG
ncbi:MAG: WYL domain-containing protein [Lentisphaeria bacterium]|nr:WYL domain-containing protein [Lentisphaeria bacterium]